MRPDPDTFGWLDEPISIVHIAGVEGPSIGINEYRVGGPKPWGGGRVVKEWTVTPRDILQALVGRNPDRIDADTTDALAWHTARKNADGPYFLRALAQRLAREQADSEDGGYVLKGPIVSADDAEPPR